MAIRLTSDWNEPEFDSFCGAVTAVVQSDRSKLAVADSVTITGLALCDVFMTSDTVYMVLGNGLSIILRADNKNVEWIISKDTIRPVSAVNWVDCEPVVCYFVQSGEEYKWDRREFFRQLVGEKVECLSASFSMVFLSTSSCREVCFSSTRNEDSGDTLLFYGFSSS